MFKTLFSHAYKVIYLVQFSMSVYKLVKYFNENIQKTIIKSKK